MLPREIDLVFAMSAVSAASNQSFQLMKDTVKSIVDSYGTSRIHYSVLLYSALAVPMFTFADRRLSEEAFKAFIDTLPKTSQAGTYCVSQIICLDKLNAPLQ